jgi:hypothetical protein
MLHQVVRVVVTVLQFVCNQYHTLILITEMTT